jgi:hypothetical protein
MATLQAARALELGLPMSSALSWGLNRAIFYAVAKRGFKGKTGTGAPSDHKPGVLPQEYHLGDEKAYIRPGSKKLCFVIGGEPQTQKDFEKQIASRFEGRFVSAWDEALYIRLFDRDTLLSGQGFFASVYRRKRDEFAAKWTALADTATAATNVQPKK